MIEDTVLVERTDRTGLHQRILWMLDGGFHLQSHVLGRGNFEQVEKQHLPRTSRRQVRDGGATELDFVDRWLTGQQQADVWWRAPGDRRFALSGSGSGSGIGDVGDRAFLDGQPSDRQQVEVEVPRPIEDPRSVCERAPIVTQPASPERAAAGAVGEDQPGNAVPVESQAG